MMQSRLKELDVELANSKEAYDAAIAHRNFLMDELEVYYSLSFLHFFHLLFAKFAIVSFFLSSFLFCSFLFFSCRK